jgi:hypothetical protein
MIAKQMPAVRLHALATSLVTRSTSSCNVVTGIGGGFPQRPRTVPAPR